MENRKKPLFHHTVKAKKSIGEARKKEWADGRRDHQRGKINRGRALIWKLRSPEGKTHLVESLEHWCRDNEALFKPDANPGSKNPLWLRAARGIAESFNKEGRSHWRGWEVISKQDLNE